MPLIGTRGAASSGGFGQFAQTDAVNYIENVFSTYLYTGNNTSQTITNGIDLSTKGGLVWIKSRAGTYVREHYLYDTVRGTILSLSTDTTAGNINNSPNGVSAYNTTGFNIVGSLGSGGNGTGTTYTSWTFRKQPKFFDVVTYTGNNTTNVINHSLGSTPACIIVKQTSLSGNDWWVYHKDLPSPNNSRLKLNGIEASYNIGYQIWDTSSTTFTVFGSNGDSNQNGTSYVAYLFASNAGGFGLTGTDNVISCGSMTTSAITGKATVTLGYEPQFVITKAISTTSNWITNDIMRGMPTTDSATAQLYPNLTNAEASGTTGVTINSTGFSFNSGIGGTAHTYIYIAIRRGPMKVPTSGTSVMGISARTGTGANATVTGGQTDDAVLIKNRGSAVASLFSSRLTGTGYLVTSSTAAEVAAGTTILQANPWDVMDGVKVGTTSTITNATSNTFINYLFKRAPSFFDVVCFTSTASTNQRISHNLTVAPDLIITKSRNATGFVGNWWTYISTSAVPSASRATYFTFNTNSPSQTLANTWGTSDPTATDFGMNTSSLSSSGTTIIAYLFATLAGVSKVGSYTGNGSTQTINCGFGAGGVRFVLIKRTDSIGGDWYVYDTARGMTTLTDPYWLTDSTAAEVATLGSVTTVSTGFALNSTILADINISAGTYFFLAIA